MKILNKPNIFQQVETWRESDPQAISAHCLRSAKPLRNVKRYTNLKWLILAIFVGIALGMIFLANFS